MLFNWLLEHHDHNVTSCNWNTNILEKFRPLPDYLGGIVVRGFKVVKSEHVKSDDLSGVKTCFKSEGPCASDHAMFSIWWLFWATQVLQMGFFNCTMFAFSGRIYELTSTSQSDLYMWDYIACLGNVL